MPKVTFDLDDATFAATKAALCANYGWSPTVPNPGFVVEKPESPANPRTIPNPQTDVEFAVLQIQRFVGDSIRAYNANRAGEHARQAALAATNEALVKSETKVTIE